ncbi:hypothetical protein [Butyrivibrio sp. INlla14]|uniref:hypothetical protein n=1 Tax=Butyrivibrio sp. INlla14 TaxID=1520808 RepID=UPI0008771942|nr:hypothetical protein [Butyrivibrio sp. INlla14]SCY76105.1 hypothetical protein SAMN02910371_03771 [Butyrivibrio sp. INlla14]
MKKDFEYVQYLRNMKNIKKRIKSVKYVRNHLTSTMYTFTDIEYCTLQIRKILELIAISSLISDYKIYKEKMDSINKMWKADLIIKDLERINPKFYPEPTLTIKRVGEIDKLVVSDKEYLTKELFVEVYNKCGKMLHSLNPLCGEKSIDDLYAKYNDCIDIWIMWIENLLENHVVVLLRFKEDNADSFKKDLKKYYDSMN